MTATYCGSPLYTSPEIILKRPYLGPECDVWSLGVILYTMLTATMPFDDSNFPKFMHQVEIGEYPEPLGVSDGKYCLPLHSWLSKAKIRFILSAPPVVDWLTPFAG